MTYLFQVECPMGTIWSEGRTHTDKPLAELAIQLVPGSTLAGTPSDTSLSFTVRLRDDLYYVTFIKED